MKKRKCDVGGLVLAFAVAALAADAADVRLSGPFGEKLDKLIENHVKATDVRLLTDVFRGRSTEYLWHTEFWGKYMHGAVPLWKYSGSPDGLRAKLDFGIDRILAAQEPGGYIGNYTEETRCGRGWDVWGMKYTMMGLMFYSDGVGGEKGARALAACRKLCDYLIGELGPNGRRGRPLRFTGNYGGMPSCSVLEPVVWLYKRTREKRYLDFAACIVGELTERPDGPNLLKQADVPVADRFLEEVAPCRKWEKDHALTKAYEMMSCYQGLLEYCEVTGRKDLLDAAVRTAEHIVKEEINLAGGSAAGEHWWKGDANQHRNVSWQQETCVTTTWMRFCQKLLELTDDPRWADQLEKTFYNIYLASMDLEATQFAAYTPFNGYRAPGHHHCRMHTNCCNANGPRGFVAFLESMLTAKESSATFNFYASSNAAVEIPALGKSADFQMYTLYPRENAVGLWYRTHETLDFTLRLRIPAFSGNTAVKVNGKPFEGAVRAGSYLELKRRWTEGDGVELVFDLPVRRHVRGECVAFTRGPVLLARDARFADGPMDEVIRQDKLDEATLAGFHLVRVPDAAMFMGVAAPLPVGYHSEDPDNGSKPSDVHFTDYASAGNRWDDLVQYRVWLPLLIRGRNY